MVSVMWLPLLHSETIPAAAMTLRDKILGAEDEEMAPPEARPA
jgi:hypothetical protein